MDIQSAARVHFVETNSTKSSVIHRENIGSTLEACLYLCVWPGSEIYRSLFNLIFSIMLHASFKDSSDVLL